MISASTEFFFFLKGRIFLDNGQTNRRKGGGSGGMLPPKKYFLKITMQIEPLFIFYSIWARIHYIFPYENWLMFNFWGIQEVKAF